MTTFRNRRQVEHQILWQISKTQIKIYVMPMLKVRLIQSDLTSISAISFRRLRELHSQNLESSSSRNAKHSDGVRDMERDLAGYYNKSCKRQRAKMQSWALEKPLSSKYKGMQQFLTPKDIITNSGQPAADAIGQDYSGIDVSTDAGLMAWQRNAITKCIGSHQTAPQPRGKEVDALVESSKRNEALNVPEVAVDNTNKFTADDSIGAPDRRTIEAATTSVNGREGPPVDPCLELLGLKPTERHRGSLWNYKSDEIMPDYKANLLVSQATAVVHMLMRTYGYFPLSAKHLEHKARFEATLQQMDHCSPAVHGGFLEDVPGMAKTATALAFFDYQAQHVRREKHKPTLLLVPDGYVFHQ